MKKYKVKATITFPTELVIKAADKDEAYDVIKNILRGRQLLEGCWSEGYINVTDIDIKKVKKNG